MLPRPNTKTAVQVLDEPRAGRMNIGYRPDQKTEIIENPPRFTWMPVIEDEATYALRISTDSNFSSAGTRVFDNIPINFFTPDEALPPGRYFWSYAVWSEEAR